MAMLYAPAKEEGLYLPEEPIHICTYMQLQKGLHTRRKSKFWTGHITLGFIKDEFLEL